MLHVIQRNKDLMSDAISLINEIGIKMNNISLSNWICKNAYTGEFHQDKDSSYSLICVPFINHSESSHFKAKKGQYGFTFCWDRDNKSGIKFKLDPGVSIYFLGSICNHRQYVINDGEFCNFTSYQNRRLYSSLKCSISRLLNDHH